MTIGTMFLWEAIIWIILFNHVWVHHLSMKRWFFFRTIILNKRVSWNFQKSLFISCKNWELCMTVLKFFKLFRKFTESIVNSKTSNIKIKTVLRQISLTANIWLKAVTQHALYNKYDKILWLRIEWK